MHCAHSVVVARFENTHSLPTTANDETLPQVQLELLEVDTQLDRNLFEVFIFCLALNEKNRVGKLVGLPVVDDRRDDLYGACIAALFQSTRYLDTFYAMRKALGSCAPPVLLRNLKSVRLGTLVWSLSRTSRSALTPAQ